MLATTRRGEAIADFIAFIKSMPMPTAYGDGRAITAAEKATIRAERDELPDAGFLYVTLLMQKKRHKQSAEAQQIISRWLADWESGEWQWARPRPF